VMGGDGGLSRAGGGEGTNGHFRNLFLLKSKGYLPKPRLPSQYSQVNVVTCNSRPLTSALAF
jgi:hypothetical protein